MQVTSSKAVAIVVALALVLGARSARAQDPAEAAPYERGFGDPGVIAIAGSTGAQLDGVAQGNGASMGFDLTIAPAVQVFVVQDFSVGGSIELDWSKSPSSVVDNGTGGVEEVTTTTIFGVGPTVGYNVRLTRLLSLWPQVTYLLKFGTMSTGPRSSSPPGGPGSTVVTVPTQTESAQVMTVGLLAPLLIHPAKHFYIGIGPFLQLDVASTQTTGNVSSDATKNTRFGLRFEVGGWL